MELNDEWRRGCFLPLKRPSTTAMQLNSGARRPTCTLPEDTMIGHSREVNVDSKMAMYMQLTEKEKMQGKMTCTKLAGSLDSTLPSSYTWTSACVDYSRPHRPARC